VRVAHTCACLTHVRASFSHTCASPAEFGGWRSQRFAKSPPASSRPWPPTTATSNSRDAVLEELVVNEERASRFADKMSQLLEVAGDDYRELKAEVAELRMELERRSEWISAGESARLRREIRMLEGECLTARRKWKVSEERARVAGKELAGLSDEIKEVFPEEGTNSTQDTNSTVIED